VGNSDLWRLRGSLEIQAPGLLLPSPDLYSWRFSEHLEATFIRAEPARVSVIQWAPHSVGNSDLRRLRGILEIQALGLFLPSLNLSVGIFIRVIGHFWQQGRVIEGFILLLERGILQLESLAFRSACIDLHFLFSLWRHYFVLAGAFCSSSYLLSIFLAIC
jgi:hypothetical protein